MDLVGCLNIFCQYFQSSCGTLNVYTYASSCGKINFKHAGARENYIYGFVLFFSGLYREIKSCFFPHRVHNFILMVGWNKSCSYNGIFALLSVYHYDLWDLLLFDHCTALCHKKYCMCQDSKSWVCILDFKCRHISKSIF